MGSHHPRDAFWMRIHQNEFLMFEQIHGKGLGTCFFSKQKRLLSTKNARFFFWLGRGRQTQKPN